MLFAAYYRQFRRFEAKCFLADAFHYLNGTAKTCLIDNTSVVLAAGSCANAQISSEMAGFARGYGVTFAAHRINHPERKGRVERPFHYLENNLLAGSTFSSLDDLNASASDWCNQMANDKVKRSIEMFPKSAYLMEKPFLLALPKVCPLVYESLFRVADTTGYVHVKRNRYSVPDRLEGKRLEVHHYFNELKVYFRSEFVATHQICEKRDQRIAAGGVSGAESSMGLQLRRLCFAVVIRFSTPTSTKRSRACLGVVFMRWNAYYTLCAPIPRTFFTEL
ncbi:DDE-type integrase/transposase/recombinase [Sulfidibacter corallicola]|nr:hypothetical protein [Sulfidibacter corallicola]